MRHRSGSAGDPRQWLKTAKGDLVYARLPLPEGGMYEQPCFHAEQAAEKSLKAVLLKCGIKFPFTHNLQMLSDLLPENMEKPDAVRDAFELNAYAVLTRYPGELEPVTQADYTRALYIAESVYEWAQKIVEA